MASEQIHPDWETMEKGAIIGEGTYGKVHLMSDPRYVCKVPKIKSSSDSVEISVIREIAAFRKLEGCNNIVKCIGITDTYEIYMPKYECTLKDYMKTAKLSSNQIRNFMYKIICGVRDMHDVGVIHRDLKPENILVGDDIVICDLGMSRFGIDCTMPITGTVQSRACRAPEVILGERNYTAAIDIWSIGVIMCHLICGGTFKPFEGDSDIDQLFKYFRMFGTPTGDTWPGVEKLPNYKSSFPQWSPKLFPKCIRSKKIESDLILHLLTMDPRKRITASDALKHEYFSGLYSNPRKIPVDGIINHTYMNRQIHISVTMRTILIDWMFELTFQWKLNHATIFLACNYLDKFLMQRLVAKTNLQLIGMTALVIASKIIEIYPPLIDDYVDICDNLYSRDTIISMEKIMIKVLNYDLYCSTEYTYMMRSNDVHDIKSTLKKLYRAVLSLENRKYTWNELLLGQVRVDVNHQDGYNKMCMLIDNQ